MSNTFGIYKKIYLTFNALDNISLLPVLAEHPHKYVGARKEGRQILKYYRQGFSIKRIDEFLADHGQDTTYRPNSSYVLLLSMNRSTMANGSTVIKSRNKVQLVVPIEITSVRDGDRVFNDPGLSVDPTIFDNISLTVNVFTGQAELVAHVAEMKDYTEKPEDIVAAVRLAIDPVVEKLSLVLGDSVVAVWGTEEGETAMLQYVETFLAKTGLTNPLVTKSRVKLAERLMEGLSLAAVEEDDVQWDSPSDKAYDLKEAGGDVELAKARRRDVLRMKFLLDECSFDRRLVEMTREEIENTVDLNRPNITLAMTDEEVTTWYAGGDTSEIEFTVLDRYLKAKR